MIYAIAVMFPLIYFMGPLNLTQVGWFLVQGHMAGDRLKIQNWLQNLDGF